MAAAAAAAVVPRYTIDLSAPARERWSEVVADYKKHFADAEAYLTDMLEDAGAVAAGIRGVLKLSNKLGLVMYHDELAAIAEQADFDLGKLIMLQLAYEAAACCTSIVTSSGVHGRTMDWEGDFLAHMTIEVEFRDEGHVVCVGTTWAGYVGLLTGVSQGWSASVNFRATADGTYWENVKKLMAYHWPIGFFLRWALTEKGFSYAQAVRACSDALLVAPCYLTLCGSRPGQGTVLTRSREGVEHPVVLYGDEDDEKKGGPVSALVQANRDHFSERRDDDIMDSIERVRSATRWLEQNEVVEPNDIVPLLMSEPICNEITIYMCVMQPRSPEPYLKTEVRGVTFDRPKLRRCAACGAGFSDRGAPGNFAGECAHSEPWHSALEDCKLLKCARGLGMSRIGRQHWGCCFSTDRDDLVCAKSGKHRSYAINQAHAFESDSESDHQ